MNELIAPEHFGGQTARNYSRYDLAFSPLVNLKFFIGRIWTTFGGFVGELFDEKLDYKPVESWLCLLCVLVYMLSHGSLYLPY